MSNKAYAELSTETTYNTLNLYFIKRTVPYSSISKESRRSKLQTCCRWWLVLKATVSTLRAKNLTQKFLNERAVPHLIAPKTEHESLIKIDAVFCQVSRFLANKHHLPPSSWELEFENSEIQIRGIVLSRSRYDSFFAMHVAVE